MTSPILSATELKISDTIEISSGTETDADDWTIDTNCSEVSNGFLQFELWTPLVQISPYIWYWSAWFSWKKYRLKNEEIICGRTNNLTWHKLSDTISCSILRKFGRKLYSRTFENLERRFLNLTIPS